MVKCKICYDWAELTKWNPPKGIDLKMKRYKCRNGHFTYKVDNSITEEEWIEVKMRTSVG